MKRFLKIAFIIPILFLTSLFAFACGEVSMQSIALSINKEGVTYSNGYYYVEKTNESITIDTVITPSDFSAQDLTWKSSNTNVAKVYYNSFKTVGVGEATITASYQNKDGKIISATLRLNVNASNPEITFDANSLTKVYNGTDQKTNFIAKEEKTNTSNFVFDADKSAYKFETDAKFYYQYYNYQTKQMTNELIDAGSYKILCKSLQDENIETTVDVVISKHKLTFTAASYNYIEYGDELPEGLINENNIPSDFLTQTTIGKPVTNGVGREEGVEIGKQIDITSADVGSNVSGYKVGVHFELKNEYKSNYEVEANINQSTINIIKKKVVIVVDSQNLVYGQSIVANKYKMYSYQNYTSAGERINLLLDTKVDYNSNIYLGEPSYKVALTTDDDNASYQNIGLNSAGVLDVLTGVDDEEPYYLFYDGVVSRYGNLEIVEMSAGQKVVPGEVKVAKREVEILPKAGQSKKYSQADPQNITYQITSGSFVNNDNLKEFLYIDYSKLIDGQQVNTNLQADNAGNDDYIENNPHYNYNYTAVVGSYFYKIDNTLNKNYNITLNPQAIEAENGSEDNTTKVSFEVKPCDIYIEFTDVTADYSTPNSNDGKHTISYYSKVNSGGAVSTPNYKTEIKSLKINNQEFVQSTADGYAIDNLILDKDFDTNGIIYILANQTPKASTPNYKAVGGFYMSLGISTDEQDINALKPYATQNGHYITYPIKPSVVTIQNPNTSATNYKFDIDRNNESVLDNAKLNLNKIKIVVTPTMTESLFSKIYDATETVQDTFGLLVGQANRDEYFKLSDTSLDLNSIMAVSEILVFEKDTSGNYINLDGTEEEDNINTSNIINVGRYKITLNDFSQYENNGCLPNKEHYELVLDTSQQYYFTVKPRPLTIVPVSGQSKVYATSAQEQLLYTIAEEGDYKPNFDLQGGTIDGYTITGALSRTAGESVGLYQIKLGNLDFGKNFVLSLYETPVNFEITKRSVRIKPIKYSILYGENYPTQIGYEKEIIKTYDDEILNNAVAGPVFSGQFVINGSKIGNYYPVKIVDGKITGYQILQGTFVCDNNYSIVFEDTSTFTVNKRPIILNIKAQSKTQTEAIATSGVVINSEFYEVSNLVDSALTELIVNLTKESGIYTVDTYTLNIVKNSVNLNNCYEVTLGKDVVYNIDVAMVYLKIMGNDLLTNTTNVVYNGYYRDNTYKYNEDRLKLYNPDFTLLSESADFVIVKDNNKTGSELKQTNFNFEYFTFTNNQQVNVNSPKDVGSYTAKINLGTAEDDYRIVIYNAVLDEYVVFESFEESVVDNYALSISNIGYLNIEKANLTVTDASLLGFVNDLEYNSSNLSNIIENDYSAQSIIFEGVGEDKIVLKKFNTNDFGERNFKTTTTKEDLLSFNANSKYILTLQVEAVKLNGLTPEVDANGNQVSSVNYNPLFINVSLNVVPKKIIYNQASFTVSGAVDGEIVYNSLAKSVDLNLIYKEEDKDPVVLDSKNIVYNYNYVRLATEYVEEDGMAVGYLRCLGYVKDTNSVTGDVYLSQIDNASTARTQLINGVQYVIINDDTAVLISDNQEDVPKSAGMYICFATCQTNDNYAFVYVDSDENQDEPKQNVTFCCLYEIKKSQQISVDWKENKFYYTTVFDFANQHTLPFEYEIPAEVKQNVEYILEGDVEVPVNNMLNVGEYNVSLKVDTKNYYYKQTYKFFVVDLPAVVVVPVNSSYVYTGNPITSFVTGIGVTLKNKDGEALNTIYWTSQSTEFTFVFKKILEDNTKVVIGEYTKTEDNNLTINDIAPKDVGNYVLEIVYKSKEGNFGGSGEYYYSIIKQSYTGSIGFVDTTIYYQPSLTQQEFYNLVIGRMFTIGIEQSGYTLSLHSETDQKDIKPDSSFEDYCEYNKVGQKTLLLTISFNDGITAPSTLKALLNIQRYTLEASDFAYLSNSTDYEYTGYNVYHALSYDGIDLSPGAQKHTTINNNGAVKYNIDYNEKVITVKDRLNHELFTLTYVYTKQYANADPSTVDYYPIVPNTMDDNPNNNYRVAYNFNFGLNYSGRNISYTYVDYTIRKSKLLNISFADVTKNTVKYTGEGQANFVPAELSVKNNNIIGYSNLKYTICYNSSAQSVGYTETKGVYLLLYFTDLSGNKLKASEVVEVGTYKIYVTLYCSSDYKISDYFEEFNFGTEGGLMTNFEQNIVDDEYGYSYSGEFKIVQKPYDVSTITQVLSLTNFDINGEQLVLSRESSVLKILQNNSLTIKIQKASNGLDAWTDFKTDFDTGDTTKEYRFNGVSNGENVYSLEDTYCFVISDANHLESRIVWTLV